MTFTTTAGQKYTRRVSDVVDPKVLAGIKVGDRLDVTRTEATNLAVVTPAPPPQVSVTATSETLRDRLTISVLWGVDNSFSGEIAQDGNGEYLGTPINFVDTPFDSAYGKMGLLKIGVGYRLSPRSEANFNLVFSNSTSETIEIGTVGTENAPLSVKFGDYNYWGLEGGQRFFFSRVRFTPFVGYTLGVNRFSSISADFSAPATGPQAAHRGQQLRVLRGVLGLQLQRHGRLSHRSRADRADGRIGVPLHGRPRRRTSAARNRIGPHQRRQLAVVDPVPHWRALALLTAWDLDRFRSQTTRRQRLTFEALAASRPLSCKAL